MSLAGRWREVNLADLSQALIDAGWQLMGQSRGILRFEDSSTGPRRWVLLPKSMDVVGAEELLDETWQQLESLTPGVRDCLERNIAHRRTPGVHDSLRFRKETAAPRGLISWTEGECLVKAARETLVASAKASTEKRPYFGNSHGRFAQRYLSACYMGQTGIGSYVVTALTPVTHIDISMNQKSQYARIQGRDVTEVLAAALEAAVESVDHYNSTRSVEGFRAAVSRGLSVELVRGLVGLVDRAEEATIYVEFNAANATLLGDNDPVEFMFTEADAPALEAASVTLASEPNVVLKQKIRGRVHLLTKAEIHGPGVVGIDTGAGKYRVRLSPEEYLRAVRAHETEAVVVAEGRPSKEGNIVWLYDATLINVEAVAATLF